MNERVCRFDYGLKWDRLLVIAFFFGACGAILAYSAAGNKTGLSVAGMTLNPKQATLFYWFLSVASGVFVLLAAVGALFLNVGHKVLELESDELILPCGVFQTKTVRIPYASIEKLSELKIKRQRFLYITTGGKKFVLNAALLPDRACYDLIKDIISSRSPVGL
ncbi:MAG TPA: hypothetical protein VGJ04_02225 [Pirellulales bacterium]|jgi:uncharacterized membrane protein YsdA (DUF1294 family)